VGLDKGVKTEGGKFGPIQGFQGVSEDFAEAILKLCNSITKPTTSKPETGFVFQKPFPFLYQVTQNCLYPCTPEETAYLWLTQSLNGWTRDSLLSWTPSGLCCLCGPPSLLFTQRALVVPDVSEERVASVVGLERISELLLTLFLAR
jgi:hypothetical protein